MKKIFLLFVVLLSILFSANAFAYVVHIDTDHVNPADYREFYINQQYPMSTHAAATQGVEKLLMYESMDGGQAVLVDTKDCFGATDCWSNTKVFSKPQKFHTYYYIGYAIYSDRTTLYDSITIAIVNAPPVAIIDANPMQGDAPLSVDFSGARSYDNDGTIVSYAWDFGDGNGGNGVNINHVYQTPGDYTATLTVTDNDGATGTARVVIHVTQRANQAPDINITDPVNGQTIFGVYNVLGTASDDVAVLSVDVNVDNGPWIRATGTNAWNYALDTTQLSNGQHTINARAFDGQLYGYDSVIVNVDNGPANLPPDINITDPINGQEIWGTYGVRGTASDDVAVLSVEINVDNGAWLPAIGTNNWFYNLDTTQWTDGPHTIYARAFDGQLYGYDQVTVNINNQGHENQAPDINITDPVNGQEIWGTYRTLGTASDDVAVLSVDVNVDNGQWQRATGTTSWNYDLDTTQWTDGQHTINARAFDGQLYGYDSVTVNINNSGHQPRTLNVTNINCFRFVTVNHDQVCDVHVEDNFGNPVENAHVKIYFYPNNETFGDCYTGISGGCNARHLMTQIGRYTVFATAEKQGYIPDMDDIPRFTFDVFAERYEIRDLDTYNDSLFRNPDDVFYRGEALYAKFRVWDIYNQQYIRSDIITRMTLTSAPGGRAEMTEMRMNDEWYYFRLDTIPLTHDFKGNSSVFAFAFNFSDNSSGQAEAPITILNNPPKIFPIAPIVTDENTPVSIDLSQYEFDLEDHGNNLRWTLQYRSLYFTAGLNGKTLTVLPIHVGAGDSVTLTLYDLDNDYDVARVPVTITSGQGRNQPPTIRITDPRNGQEIFGTYRVKGTAFDIDGTVELVEVAVDPIGIWKKAVYDRASNEWFFDLDTTQYNDGEHMIYARAIDNDGAVSYDQVKVMINNHGQGNLTADAGGPYTGYVNEQVTMDASGSTGNIIKYVWDFGDGTSAESQLPTIVHNYTAIGRYNVKLTVYDAAGRSAEDFTTATIIERTTPKKEVTPEIHDELYIGRLQLYDQNTYEDSTVHIGNDLTLDIDMHNYGERDLEDLRVTLMIPDLGIQVKSGAFDLDRGETVTKQVSATVYDATPGEYYARILVTNGDVKRAKDRYVIIK